MAGRCNATASSSSSKRHSSALAGFWTSPDDRACGAQAILAFRWLVRGPPFELGGPDPGSIGSIGAIAEIACELIAELDQGDRVLGQGKDDGVLLG